MKKNKNKWVVLFILLIIILAGAFFLKYYQKTTGNAVGPIKGRCSTPGSTPCPKSPDCCLPSEKCLTKNTKMGLGAPIYACCPDGFVIDNIATTLKSYCKPKDCQGTKCVDLCCTKPNNVCKKITYTGVDIKGQCSNHKGCDSNLGEKECGKICCQKNEDCKPKHDPNDPSKELFYYCTASSCEDPTPEECTSTEDGDKYTICCPKGQCQRNINNQPYCYNPDLSPSNPPASIFSKVFRKRN